MQSIGCNVTYVGGSRPELLQEGVPFVKGTSIAVKGEGKVSALEVDGTSIPCQGVFILRQSVAPTDLLPGLKVDNGAIVVDRKMSTGMEGVFAAGDCTGGPLQISKAVGEGLVAALSACEWIDEKGR